jgi:hypothetical protein
MSRSGIRTLSLTSLVLLGVLGSARAQYPSPPGSALPPPGASSRPAVPSNSLTIDNGDPYSRSCKERCCEIPPVTCVRQEYTTGTKAQYGCKIKVVCLPDPSKSGKCDCNDCCGRYRTVRVLWRRNVPKDRCESVCVPVPCQSECHACPGPACSAPACSGGVPVALPAAPAVPATAQPPAQPGAQPAAAPPVLTTTPPVHRSGW